MDGTGRVRQKGLTMSGKKHIRWNTIATLITLAVLLSAGGRVMAFLQGGGEPSRFLLVAGKPLREPIARAGPFVMNTEAELRQDIALNGGLFECLDYPKTVNDPEKRYDGFSETPSKQTVVPNMLFFGQADDLDFSDDFGGDKKSITLQYIDWKNIENNVYHVTEEFSVMRSTSKEHYRPDLVLFVNGIPFCIIECKRPDMKEPLKQGSVAKH